MIHGLQVTMPGQELRERISQRIRLHAEKTSVLDARIKKREGDAPFDVRAEDGWETLGELETEREHHRNRAAELTLFRDRLTPTETHSLGLADLRAADLMSWDDREQTNAPDLAMDPLKAVPVDGLKLTISGEQVHRLLEERIESHRASAERWKRESARSPEEQTDEEPLLPGEMCENEAERHEWRAELLAFIRDHLDTTEMYRLGEADLQFGELLPRKPDWLELEEYACPPKP